MVRLVALGVTEAMSHKEVLKKVLEAIIVPYLVTHDPLFYRDRHLHKGVGHKENAMTPVAGCLCCNAMTSLHNGCTECITAWKLTMVSRLFKTKVMAYSNTLWKFWWVWTREYKLYKRGKGPNPYANKGKGKGYEPQGGSQPQEPLACLDQPTGGSEGWQGPAPNQCNHWMAEQGEAFDVPVASYYTPPIVAPTVLDSPTESCTTPERASGEEDRNWGRCD